MDVHLHSSTFTPRKPTWNPKNEGLEDDVPPHFGGDFRVPYVFFFGGGGGGNISGWNFPIFQ